MLVVMLVLLAATASATFAVHATTMDLRSAGFARQAMQTKYIGETGAMAALDLITRIGPQGLLYALDSVRAAPGSTPVGLDIFREFGEPPLAAGKQNYRLYFDPAAADPAFANDFANNGGTASANLPIEDATRGRSLGRVNSTPRIVVDINDQYVYQMPTSGERSDGRGNFYFLGATITSRGRADLTGATRDTDPTHSSLFRRHETSNDSRAQLLAGPFVM